MKTPATLLAAAHRMGKLSRVYSSIISQNSAGQYIRKRRDFWPQRIGRRKERTTTGSMFISGILPDAGPIGPGSSTTQMLPFLRGIMTASLARGGADDIASWMMLLSIKVLCLLARWIIRITTTEAMDGLRSKLVRCVAVRPGLLAAQGRQSRRINERDRERPGFGRTDRRWPRSG